MDKSSAGQSLSVALSSTSAIPVTATEDRKRDNNGPRNANLRQTGNQDATAATPDLAALKIRQQAAWSSGNYAVVGTTLQIVSEELCEALDLRSGRKVLDVAAGNGMASLAAARRWCDVISTDYVSSLRSAVARGHRPKA